VAISTAGESGGDFEELRERVRQETPAVERRPGFVRCLSEDVSFHEYALEEGGDPDDMEAVKRANPRPSITVEALTAKRRSPTMSPHHWARFVCNVPSRSGFASITEQEWHDAATAETAPKGAEHWCGLDVGWRNDTTAFVPYWWRDEELQLLGPATILEPAGDGSSIPVAAVKRAFLELQKRCWVTTVVMDMSRAEDIADWLSSELGLHVVDRAQSSKPQAEDYERFMEGLRAGTLRHSGDAGLRRHALNAVTKLLPDGGAKFGRASESRSGNNMSRVIDALVAAAMVHSVKVGDSGSYVMGFSDAELAA
jgi:phage terminase large subunit-like protein